MVVPTKQHADLRKWLGGKMVDAAELGGRLVTGSLDPLLAAVGSSHRLSQDQRAIIDDGRRTASASSQIEPRRRQEAIAGVSEGLVAIEGVLREVCDALRAAGVAATPYRGLGLVFGDELLWGKVVITDTETLYTRMRSDEASATPVHPRVHVPTAPSERRGHAPVPAE